VVREDCQHGLPCSLATTLVASPTTDPGFEPKPPNFDARPASRRPLAPVARNSKFRRSGGNGAVGAVCACPAVPVRIGVKSNLRGAGRAIATTDTEPRPREVCDRLCLSIQIERISRLRIHATRSDVNITGRAIADAARDGAPWPITFMRGAAGDRQGRRTSIDSLNDVVT